MTQQRSVMTPGILLSCTCFVLLDLSVPRLLVLWTDPSLWVAVGARDPFALDCLPVPNPFEDFRGA